MTNKSSVPKQNSITIKTATRLHSKLKKSGLSDVQIRKIAQIVMACAIDEANDSLMTIHADSLLDSLSKNALKHYKPVD